MKKFSGRRVLLLQGPVGPFFARLAQDLERVGARVFKVNFNAGDWLFYRRGAMNYRGTMSDWPEWLEERLRTLKIDVVIMFGDCRPIHREAHALADRLGLEVWVFEEGYIRPDYVTLERFGVNGNSRMPRKREAFGGSVKREPKTRPVPMPYWYMVWYGFCYFMVGSLGKPFFPHYVHHRPLNVWEMFPWLRSVWRKQLYRLRESGLQDRFAGPLANRYFFVPLQVYNDFQVSAHANVDGVPGFIRKVIRSFATHASQDDWLVLKHHPMDRGYCDYTRLIRKLSQTFGVQDRVVYVHDLHTPTLLRFAKGVVVINSTVGLSALSYLRPTKTCGQAIYDIEGLTYQASLDSFWEQGPDSPPDRELYERLVEYLISESQLNGNFYRPLSISGSRTGLVWDSRFDH